MRGGTSHGRRCARPTRFRARCGRAGGPRELASLKHARGPDPRPVLANSSGSPGVLEVGSRDAPPRPRPASFRDRWGAAFGGRATVQGRSQRPQFDLTPSVGCLCFAGDLSGWEGCPASDVRARAGPRTAPRAGRRIRRAHVFDERREEFALAPAARAVGPMRVARAQQSPWDTPPARDSCGTVRWVGAVSRSSPVSRSPRTVVRPLQVARVRFFAQAATGGESDASAGDVLLPEVNSSGGEADSSIARLYDALRGEIGELGFQARLAEGGEAGRRSAWESGDPASRHCP